MGHPCTFVHQEFLGRRHKIAYPVNPWRFHLRFSLFVFLKVSCLYFSFLTAAYFTSSSFCLPFAHFAFLVGCLKTFDVLLYLKLYLS